MSEHFTFEEKEVLKVLAKRGGCIIFREFFFRRSSNGAVCKNAPSSKKIYNDRVAIISKKVIKKLYKQSLLTKRIVVQSYYAGEYDVSTLFELFSPALNEYATYIVFELFSPALNEYEELKDIAIECALGV